MLASRFNEKLLVLRKETVQDTDGQMIATWHIEGWVYGAISYKSSKEAVNAGAILEDNQVSVRLRWDKRADRITQNDAFKDAKGNFLSIIGIFPEIADKAYIDFVCKIGVFGEDNSNG